MTAKEIKWVNKFISQHTINPTIEISVYTAKKGVLKTLLKVQALFLEQVPQQMYLYIIMA